MSLLFCHPRLKVGLLKSPWPTIRIKLGSLVISSDQSTCGGTVFKLNEPTLSCIYLVLKFDKIRLILVRSAGLVSA